MLKNGLIETPLYHIWTPSTLIGQMALMSGPLKIFDSLCIYTVYRLSIYICGFKWWLYVYVYMYMYAVFVYKLKKKHCFASKFTCSSLDVYIQHVSYSIISILHDNSIYFDDFINLTIYMRFLSSTPNEVSFSTLGWSTGTYPSHLQSWRTAW